MPTVGNVMPGSPAPLQLAGDELSEIRHVCALFRGPDEASSVLLPFIVQGLELGDRVIHVVEDADRYRARLGQSTTATTAIDSGQLKVETWDRAYLRDGRFAASEMLAYLRRSMRESDDLGYPGVRFIGEMEWAQDGIPGVGELVAYESAVDDTLQRPRDAIVCAYDVRRHSASRIVSILPAHRAVFVQGRLRHTEPMASRLSARDRIVAAASQLFAESGVRAAGVDAIIASAGVAKATFYRHFPSKDDLIVAWLSDPGTRWFYRIRIVAESRAETVDEVVPEFFAATEAWLEAGDYRGCPFLNTSVEITDPKHPAYAVVGERLEEIERFLQEAVAAAGYEDPQQLGTALQALLAGMIALGVARRVSPFGGAARDVARLFLQASGRRGSAP